MSADLRREQCCVAVVEGSPCLRPRLHGDYCARCWMGMSGRPDATVGGRVELLTPAEYAARGNANAAREALVASEVAVGLVALDAWRS
jgi:hypothetical protein